MLDNKPSGNSPIFHVYHNRNTTYPNKNSVSIITDISKIMENRYDIRHQYYTSRVSGFNSILKEAPPELTVENCSYDRYGLHIQNISED